MRVFVVFLVVVFVGCKTVDTKKNKSGKPNIVFIFTDDQTYTSIRALGNQEILTPAMDKMVEEGTTFTHAYNMGAWNGAVCMASRTMLMSGRSVWRANKFKQHWTAKDSLALSKSWSKLLESSGYETYMTGKWHISAPAEKVFNNVVNVRAGMPKDAWQHNKMVAKFKASPELKKHGSDKIMPLGYNRPQNEQDTLWSPSDPKHGGFWEGGKHWSEVLKDDAIGFINQAKSKDDPFFMYLAFNAPHDPRQAPQKYVDMYPLEAISVPKSYMPEYTYRHDIANGNNLRDEALAPFPRTEYAVKKHTQEYYASITHVDEQIGLIIDALKKSGKMDNTYIFFTADHGLAMGRHGLLGKQSLFDHSIRPPMIVMGPDIPKNKKVDADVYLQDIMATSLEIAGVEKPDYVEFNSFLDLAKRSTNKSHYKAVYGAYLDVNRMIRKDGFKLLVYPNIQKVLLFDLKNDPEEMNNIADVPSNKEKVKTLFKELLQLQEQMDDPLDLTSVFKTL